jgi:hypothetical protein
MNKILGVIAVASAFALSGCGKGIPSCGDQEVVGLATSAVTGVIENNMPSGIEPAYRKVVKLVVSEPVVESHDSHVDTYRCKAVVTYQVPDDVSKAHDHAVADQDFSTALFFKWRDLMHLYSVSDVSKMKVALAASDLGQNMGVSADDIRVALRKAVDAKSDANDIQLFAYADQFIRKADQTLLGQQLTYMKAAADATDADSKIILNIHYTVAKIDGENKVKVETTFDNNDLAQGVRNLQVMQSAALIRNAEAVEVANEAKNATPEIVPADDEVPVGSAHADPVDDTASDAQAASAPQ